MNWMGLHIRCSEEIRDVILAELSQLPFSTFEETDQGISAYCELKDWAMEPAMEILTKYGLTDFEIKEVERVNWNEQWEKNYEPIEVSSELIVRAPFHEKSGHPLEIIILPKMSFGTGHHATTFLVLEYQLTMDQRDKKVIDVGCGTGVLAIMAHKMGARQIRGIDIEDWCVENSLENCALNNCPEIVVKQKELNEVTESDFDIILANITKGVHQDLMPLYNSKLNSAGLMVLSGFFESDVPEVKNLVERSGFEFVETKSHNGWARVVCRKL